jgi:putative dimethyl sulfoxide reductase chaperone
MQTPSEKITTGLEPAIATGPRSVFRNFNPQRSEVPGERGYLEKQRERVGSPNTQDAPPALRLVKDDTAALPTTCVSEGESAGMDHFAAPAETSVDEAIARSFTYRFLAQAYEYPNEEGWTWLSNPANQTPLWGALKALANPDRLLSHQGADLMVRPAPEHFDAFISDYVLVFGHAARGSCPLNEIEYGDLKADPLFQPHRLADLAAFYRAFGVEVTEDATERQDHICLELEFMSVLAAQEAYAHEHRCDQEQISQCRAAQKKFLREHLGRWLPAFARRLAGAVGDGALGSLARFTQEFVSADCRRFGVTPGSQDLLLHPMDESASLCASCGLRNLPPGALTSTT